MQQPVYSIVQVTDQLNVGGAEQIIVMLANLLLAHGHTTAVVTTVAPGTLSNNLNTAVQRINLRRGWKWNPVTMYRLVKVLRRFDVVHVHSAYNLRYVYLASRLFLLRKPVFYHEHFGDIHIDTTVAWHQKLIYPCVIFIAVSGRLAAWATDKLKLLPQRVFVLQNTIAREAVKPFYAASPPYQLLLVSNIRRTKNIEFAVELLSRLNRATTTYSLTIIGQVNDELYYKEIQQLINDKGLTESIHFIHHCSNIQPQLKKYHLALHTAKSETGPLVLIEYIAQGLPFITYHTGEVAEQLKSYLPQFIMPDFSIEKWVQAIEQVITSPKEPMASQLIGLYEHYFSTEAYYHQCIAIYHTVLQGKAKS